MMNRIFRIFLVGSNDKQPTDESIFIKNILSEETYEKIKAIQSVQTVENLNIVTSARRRLGTTRPEFTITFSLVISIIYLVALFMDNNASFWIAYAINILYLLFWGFLELAHNRRSKALGFISIIIPGLGSFILYVLLNLYPKILSPHNDINCSLCVSEKEKLAEKFSITNDYKNSEDNLNEEPVYTNPYDELLSYHYESTVEQGDIFEYYCAFLLSNLGYEIIDIPGGGGDKGIDIIISTGGAIPTNVAVQCKSFPNSKVSTDTIQKTISIKSLKNIEVDKVAVMTTGEFTKNAQQMANENKVEIFDGNKIRELSDNLLESYTLSEIIEKSEKWRSRE